MSKHSRKVNAWGGLPDFTEHRNKQGKVTSRTRYHNGKAITVRVPKEPSYTRVGRVADYSDLPMGVLIFGIALILVAAVIGWGANIVSGALTGFWPIAGSVLAWSAAAAWAASVVFAGLATWERFTNGIIGVGAIAATLGQALLFIASAFPVVALVANPTATDSATELGLANAGTLGAVAAAFGVAISAIAISFADGFKWLLLLAAMAVTFFVCVFFAPYLGIWLPAVVGTVVVTFRFNRGEVFG